MKAKPLADRWVALELGALYGFLYLAYGAHLPYWPSWLVSRGLSPGTASTVLAFGFLLRLVVAPVSAAWAGRHGDVRPSLRLLLAISAGGFVVVALAGGGTITATILSLATMLLLIPLTPLLDGLTIDHARHGRVIYGRVRVFGSITFIVANLVSGALIASAGIVALNWWLAANLAAGFLVALFVPRPGPASPSPEPNRLAVDSTKATLVTTEAELAPSPAATWLSQIPQVVRLPTTIAVLTAAGLVQASHAVYYSLGTIHWQGLGLGAETIGRLWGLAVAAEVVLFARADLVDRARPTTLIAIGGALAAVRWAATAFDPGLAALATLQLLHAASFAATHLGAMAFIARRVPAQLATTAQGIYAALAGGLFLGLVTLGAGALYGHLAGRTYLLAAAIAATGSALALGGRRRGIGPVPTTAL